MKIIITDLQHSPKYGDFIKFNTAFGSGKGIWKSHSLPKNNEIYDVEFSLEKPLVCGTDITKSNQPDYSITETPEGMILKGKVENIDENNCLVIRIGESLILTEVIGNLQEIEGFVCILINELSIYDTNV